MSLSVGRHWAGDVERLRLALEGEDTVPRILAASQGRIGRARDAPERRTIGPRCRPRPRPDVAAGAGLAPHGDVTPIFEPYGIAGLDGRTADGDATSVARAKVGRGPADLRDGMRFVERFEQGDA